MKIICPNLKNEEVAKEFEELKNATSEAAAYHIWSQNNGNGIDKAPNGEPSKLFSDLLEHYNGDRVAAIQAKARTYSKSFRNWFEDRIPTFDPNTGELLKTDIIRSKAVDKNGEPLIMWHRTPSKNITEFDTKRIDGDDGFWFSRNKNYYTTDKDVPAYPVYLKITNPFEIKHHDFLVGMDATHFSFEEMDKSPFRKFKKEYDGLITYQEHEPEFYGDAYEITEYGTFISVRTPNQIKSIDNQGTFSTQDNNIYQNIQFNEGASDPTLQKRLFKGKLKSSVSDILKNIRNTNPLLTPFLEVISDAMIGNKHIQSTKIVLLPTRIVLENRPETTSAGYYDASTNVIYIYEDSSFKGKNGLADTTILHEIIHAFTHQALINNPSVRKEAIDLLNGVRKQLEKIYNEPYKQLLEEYKNTFYGLENEEEFLSELFANSRFVNELLKLAPTKPITQEPNNIISKLLNFILSLFKVNSKNNAYTESMLLLNDIMFNYQDTLEGYYNPYENGAPLLNPQTSDASTIKKILARNKSNISFEPTSHTYTNTNTGEIYTPVSTVKDTMGFGADTSVMTDETLAYGETAAKVGSAIHDFIHSELTGEKVTNSEVKLSKEAKKMIKDTIIPKFLSKGDEVIASEQIIANDAAKVAGTVDLIIKDKDGKIHLLDFKTKARTYKGKGKYGFDYYYSSKKETKEGGKPDSERHDFQLTMYKRMLELQGIQVDSKGIIPMEYTFNEDGIITEVWMPELEYANKKGIIPHRINNQLEQEINKTVFSNDPKATTSEIDSENLIKQSEIVQNILKVLKNQLAIYRVKGYTTKAEVLNKVINNLNKLEEGEVIVSYVNQAMELLKPLIDEYNANLAAEKAGATDVWNLRKLEAWKNYAESFINLEDIQDYLFTNSNALSFLSNDDKETLIETLATVISYKNALENSYKAKGERIWLNWLTPFTTKVEAEYRRDAEKAYKKANNGSTGLSDKTSMEKYINDYIEDHRREIELKSRELLRQQSKIATTSPLGAMSRWLDTIFESADPIVGSMAKAYHTVWMESLQEFNDKYRNLIDLLEELEKSYPSLKNNPRKFYDFMIENDEHGIRLISNISPAFQDAYEKARAEINSNPKYETNADKASAIAAWLNENAPIVGKEVLKKEKIQYLQYLLDKGEITIKQHKVLLNNEKREPSFKKSWADLTYKGVISEKVADMLRVKFNELNWAHRKPDANKYKNDKWEALEKLRESNPQDIRIRFFDFISNLSTTGDTFVPDRFKLNGRLPGMSKVLAERIVSGNMTKQLWEGVEKELKVRADDTNRGMQMTDELDRPIKFIPIFFTNTLPESEQSFDIATIYKEWFRSVNNYKYINEILPQLEYTKWVIENRKTTKTDSKGNPVKNVISRIVRNGESDIDPTTNALITDENLIAQVNAWFDQVVYGISDNDLGTFMGIDGAKALNMFQKYISLKVMGVNVVSMVNNALMAEVQQMEEAFAGQYVSKASYTRASGAYLSDLPNIMGDLGSRKITSLTNLLNEHFGIFVDYNEGSLLENNKAKKLGKLSTLYFTTNVGEHEAQSRFLQACLMEKRALDKNGNDIGSMYDFFTVENGKLVFDKNKQVANFNSKEQILFGQQVSAILRKMHGNYASYSKVALQQNGMGKIVLMFRKWIYTTAKRRWAKEYYDEFGQTFSKGFYRDGGSFYYNKVRSFFERFRDEAAALEIAEKADWSTMTEAEKANVKRFTIEVGLFTMITVLSVLLGQIDGDDDDEVTKYILNNLDYQLFRLSTDLTFYISPASFLRIVQSPLPSSSVIKQVSNLFDSLLYPTAKFKTGDWKGEYKIKKRVMDLLPIVRQVYRLRNIDDEKQLLSIL